MTPPHLARPHPARDARGFTLIELVVVLAVLATVTAFALPAIRRGSDGLQLRAGAGRVASLLREARQQAVTHRRPTRVALSSNRHGAALAWEGTENPCAASSSPIASGWRSSPVARPSRSRRAAWSATPAGRSKAPVVAAWWWRSTV